MPKSKSILAKARAWALKRKLFGPQAFLRYAIFGFVENLNQVSDDFIFKGGNLLWIYIATPRTTIDLDLATLKTASHGQVNALIQRACSIRSEIHYSLLAFSEIEQDGKLGASVTIQYETDQGASNRFEVDVVYALSTENQEIESPVHPEVTIRAATVENIIADKLAVCYRFRSGNTRMKDFDDLWRLSRSRIEIDVDRLKKLLRTKQVPKQLDVAWINPDLIRIWNTHQSRYPDLPLDPITLFSDVNKWLAEL